MLNSLLLLGSIFLSSAVQAVIPCGDIKLKEAQLISKDGSTVGTTSFDNCVPDITPPTPAWIQVPSLDTDGSFSVSYAASFNAFSYKVDYKLVTAANYSNIYSSPGLVYQARDLADGTYTFRVKACNSSNALSCSGYRTSSAVVVKRPTPPPPAPGEDSSRDLISDAVGAVKGEFRVDESGQASYSVPIFTPQGVAGVTPAVALNYNSGGGNGLVGVGWSLTAADSISRCKKSEAIDFEKNDVSLDYEDRFCLGGQRLMLYRGEYGMPDSEYRTHITSQTKIVARGLRGKGPNYFEVYRADGSISRYGNTGNSRFRTNNMGVVATTVVFWAQTYSEDRYGNRINYYYDNDESNGEFHIDRVEYSPNVSINFNFSSNRNDYSLGYIFGGKTQSKDRLESITVNDNNIEVRRYDLNYDYGLSGRSRLQSIVESKDGVSLLPLNFAWTNPSKGLTPIAGGTGGINYSKGSFINVDGDLVPDWVQITPNSGITLSSTVKLYKFDGKKYVESCRKNIYVKVNADKGIRVFDLNGDGKDEAVVSNNSGIFSVSLDGGKCLGSIYSILQLTAYSFIDRSR